MIDEVLRWLRDVLEDLERTARANHGERWEDYDIPDLPTRWQGAETHMARHDPEAVLARIAAEKRIVERCMSALVNAEVNDGPADAADFAEHVIVELAHGHRFDAPGWLERWAPVGLPSG